MSDDFMTGYVAGQGENRNNGCGFGGDWGWIVLLLLLGGGGWGWGGGFGGFGGMGMMGGWGGSMLNGMVTRADINAGFQFNDIQNGIRGIQQGLCDGFYAMNTGMLNGFHGVDNAICTLGYQTQQGFSNLGYQMKDCCCETQRLIERGFCDTNYNLATQANNIVQSGHCDTDRVIAKLDAMENTRQQEKIDALRLENQDLRNQIGRAEDRAFITANQDAQSANIIRRLGRDNPVPAYVVPNPNCCYGNPLGVGYSGFNGWNGGNGCGCGCGCAA